MKRLTLSKKIKIIDNNGNRNSKFSFWRDFKKGDILEIKMILEPLSRYSSTCYLRANDHMFTHQEPQGIAAKYISKMEYEEL